MQPWPAELGSHVTKSYMVIRAIFFHKTSNFPSTKMASSSASPASLGFVSTKLTRDYYLLWKAQFLPAVRAAKYTGFLDGTTTEITKDDGKAKEVIRNLEYDSWQAKDQHVLSYLLNSMTKDTLGPVAAAQAWAALESMFATTSKARIANLRMQLAMMKKGGMTTSAYYNKMCAIKHELAATGKVIDDEEMIAYLMNVLDYDYNSAVYSILGRAGTFSHTDVYSGLLAYDLRQEMYGETSQASVNATA